MLTSCFSVQHTKRQPNACQPQNLDRLACEKETMDIALDHSSCCSCFMSSGLAAVMPPISRNAMIMKWLSAEINSVRLHCQQCTHPQERLTRILGYIYGSETQCSHYACRHALHPDWQGVICDGGLQSERTHLCLSLPFPARQSLEENVAAPARPSDGAMSDRCRTLSDTQWPSSDCDSHALQRHICTLRRYVECRLRW